MPARPFIEHPLLRSLWPWLPLWAVLALLAIFAHGPMPMYSTRTLAVAWEMWHSHQLLVPHLNGAPYSHKVPLLYWLIHAGWWLGGVNDIWPRLLQWLLAGTQLLLAFVLARRLAPDRPQVARASAWMLVALGYAFLFELQIMYEVLLGVWVLAALLCLLPKTGRAAPRFGLFALCLGLGLLSKGPVMVLHVAFPWLLGPLWSDWAAAHRRRWYVGGALATLAGLALFGLWLGPALQAGGAQYAHEILFKQTTGRLVSAFDHAEPPWWYLPRLLVLLFPLCLWPGLWRALARLRRPLPVAVRFALSWFVPVLLVFSLVSGKQIYYLMPELAGMTLLLAAALCASAAPEPAASRWWWRPWPAALLALLGGLGLMVLPNLVAAGLVQGHWGVDLARHSRLCGLIVLVLGVLVVLPGPHVVRRLAVAGLVGAFVGNALFTLSQWQNYDVRPTAALLAEAERAAQPVASIGLYYGQFHLAGRLRQPVRELTPAQLPAWAAQHPDGVVLVEPRELSSAARQHALQVQPFRGRWLVAWRASVLAAERAGRPLPPAAAPARLLPEGYWRYAQAQTR